MNYDFVIQERHNNIITLYAMFNF